MTPTQVNKPPRTKVLPDLTDNNPVTNQPIVNNPRRFNMSAVTADAPVHIQKGLGKAVGIMVARYVAPGFITAVVLQKIVYLPSFMSTVAEWLNFNVAG